MHVLGSTMQEGGKEGAMVFNMLKGMKRLILTTAVLCGVGLFLCGSEVKAAPTSTSIIYGSAGPKAGDKRVEITITNDITDSDIEITSIEIYDDQATPALLNTKSSFTDTEKVITKSGGTGKIYLTNEEIAPVGKRTAAGKINVKKIIINFRRGIRSRCNTCRYSTYICHQGHTSG